MTSLIDSIVQKARVSRSTAYRVLSGSQGVSEASRNRVLQVVSTVGKPTLRPRRRPSSRLALWLPGLGQLLGRAHHRAIVQALESAATERNLSIEMINDPVPEDPGDAVATIQRLKVGGVLLAAFYSVEHRRMIGEKWPCVLFFDAPRMERVTAIAPDDFSGGFLAARHLLEHGHARIAAAVGDGRRPEGFSTRFAGGYALALTESGIAVDEGLILRHRANLGPVPGESADPPAGAAFLKLNPRPTALVGRDETVEGAVRFFERAGLHIPQDVSVVGYGPDADFARTGPNFSRVEYSPGKMAEAALNILTEGHSICGTVTFPVHLEQRNSVRNLRAEDR